MSASRSFIDVLVGKLTAYVDASSRPAPSVQTPPWIGSLETLPATAGVVSRAYTGRWSPDIQRGVNATGMPHAVTSAAEQHPSAHAWFHAVGRQASGIDTAPRLEPSEVADRTPAEITAIELLRRLGAPELHRRSSDDDLRSAWRRLLRECHPDAHPHVREAERIVLTAKLRAVIRARDILDARTPARPAAA